MNRYYIKHFGLSYKVQDRALGISICVCVYREQAVLIAKALNALEEQTNAKYSPIKATQP
jgi:hypothetical protein